MLGRRYVEEGFVERDGLDERRALVEDRQDRIRRLEIAVEVSRDVDPLRAQAPRDGEGHRRSHPEDARLVGRRHDDPSLVRAVPADYHRLAAVLGMVALLNRCVERVEVAVEDRAGHANRIPVVVVSGARKRSSPSPSTSIATRSFGERGAKGEITSIASFFARPRLHVPAANPSTVTTASTIAFFA